jgi:hypothetical protein
MSSDKAPAFVLLAQCRLQVEPRRASFLDGFRQTRPCWESDVGDLRRRSEVCAQDALRFISVSDVRVVSIGPTTGPIRAVGRIEKRSVRVESWQAEMDVVPVVVAGHAYMIRDLENDTWAVVAIEATTREVQMELRPIGGELPAQIVENVDQQAAGIAFRLQHEGRHCADQHKFGDATAAVSHDVAYGFATAGGMSDMDRIAEVKVVDDRRSIVRVVIHVVASADLARASVTAALASVEDDGLIPRMSHERDGHTPPSSV